MANPLDKMTDVGYIFDRTMLPYYCDNNGIHLMRNQLSNPDIIPNVLLRAFRDNMTYAMVIGDTAKIIDCDGQLVEAINASEARNYINEIGIGFLDEIKTTCASCFSVVSRPGAVAREGKTKYHHILCANCAGMLPRH